MKRCLSLRRRRPGFTLLELLVVISIIAVLAGFLIPAVQRIREAANQARCINNLHQIGLAMSIHFNTQQCLPMNGTVIPNNSIYPFGLTSYPGSPAKYIYMWGMGDPRLGPKAQTGSWAYALLSYLEEMTAFATPLDLNYPSQSGYTQAVAVYQCPSRGRTGPQLNAGSNGFWNRPWSFNQNWSPIPGGVATTPLPNFNWGKTDYAGNYLMMPNVGTTDLSRFNDPPPPLIPPFLGGARNYPITISDIVDGTSNTILVGEKAMAIGAYNTGGWVWDEPIFAGGSGGTSRGVPPSISPPKLPASHGGPNSTSLPPSMTALARWPFPTCPSTIHAFWFRTMIPTMTASCSPAISSLPTTGVQPMWPASTFSLRTALFEPLTTTLIGCCFRAC